MIGAGVGCVVTGLGVGSVTLGLGRVASRVVLGMSPLGWGVTLGLGPPRPRPRGVTGRGCST